MALVYTRATPAPLSGGKMSVREFNANSNVKRDMEILHGHMNRNAVPGAGLLGIKERPDEYLNNPAESMRDEVVSLTTLAGRRLAIENAPEHVKAAHRRLIHVWDNETEIKGFGEGLTAAKDYTIDLLTSPENFIGGGFLAAGKTAVQTAARGAAAGAAWAGADDYIRQTRDVEIDLQDKVSTSQALAATAAGAAFGGIIGVGGHHIAKYVNKKVDLDLENKIEGKKLEVDTSTDEIVAVADKEIPTTEVDKVRAAYFEAQRELDLRKSLYGSDRPEGFTRDQARDSSPLEFGTRLDLGIRGEGRTPRKTPVEIIFGEHRKSKANWGGNDETPRGAFYNREEDKIYIDRDFLREQFKDKPWETPKVKGVNPLPEEFANKYLKTPDDWVRFVEIHEKSHTEFLRQLDPSDAARFEGLGARGDGGRFIAGKAKYENRINAIAMEELSDPRLFPTPEVIAFNKKYGGGGAKSDEELNDLVRSTFIQLEGMPEEEISAGLNNALGKWANRYGSHIIFKPVAILNNFKQSSVAKGLQQKFRYDAQRDWFGARKYDDQDFGEVFKETLGDSYVPFKDALNPIQSKISGKLEKDVNTILVEVVQGGIETSGSKTIDTAGKEIRRILDRIGDQLFETGAIKNKVENNYFPRSWNRKAIEKNSDDFKNLLIQSGEVNTIEEADSLVTNMLNKENQLDQGGSGGGASFFYKRAFTKLKDNDFVNYLDTDMNSVMMNYIAQSAKAIAKRKVFGVNNLEEFTSFYINGIDAQMTKVGKPLTLKDKKELQKLYNHATGENLPRFEGKPGFALDLYGSVNRMAYLPLSTISSLTEILINVAKAGPTSSIKGLYGALKVSRGTIQDKSLQMLGKKGLTEKEAWRELQEFGMNLDPIIMDTVERLSGSVIRNQTLQKVNNGFFRATFLDQWTKFVQLASYKTGKDLIGKNLREINKLKTVTDSRRISNMKDQLNELGVDINKGLKWVDGGESLDDAFYKDIKRGAARYTNEVILMPSGESGLKPFWTGDPKTSILFQFLGYPIAFTNTVLKGAVKDIVRNPTQNAPKIVAAGLMMTEMARWTNWARSRGKSEEGKSDQEIYTRAFNRWGGNGVSLDTLSRARESAKVYQDPLAAFSSLAGPIGNDVYKAIRRGDIVRLLGEKVPGYGAIGFISPKAKKAYTAWLKDKSKENKAFLIETLGLERDEEPITLNRTRKSKGGTSGSSGSELYKTASTLMEKGAKEVFGVGSKDLRDNEKAATELVNSLVDEGLINQREKVKRENGKFMSGDVFDAANHMLLVKIAKSNVILRAALQGKEFVQQLAGDTGPHGAESDRENNSLGFKLYDQAEGDTEVFENLVKANLVERFGRENKDKGSEVREEYIFGSLVKGATKLAKAGIKSLKKEDKIAKDFKKSDEYKNIVEILGSDNAEGAGYTISKKEIDTILDSKGPEGVLEEAYGSSTSSRGYVEIGEVGYKKVKDEEANFLLKIGLDPVTVRRITDEDEFPASELTKSERSIRRKVAKRFGYSSYREDQFAEPREPMDTFIKQHIDTDALDEGGELKFRPPMAKGGEVDVPNAPSEPDERIDKVTGLPYNLQAGIPFRDEEDPIKRLGLAGGGGGATPATTSIQRLGFGR